MRAVEDLEADPAVVAAWVAGWAVCRGVEAPQAAHGGHYVRVGLPTQQARYVFASVDPGRLTALAASVSEPWVFIKVCAPADRLASLWPEPWALQPSGFMMTAALVRGSAILPPDGYSLSVEGEGVVTASIHDQAGALAASGKIALAQGQATFDQIVTDEAHRRRGLGRVVMTALSAAATDAGVPQAVLVATPEGRALYEAQGWSLHSHFTTVVIPGTPAL